MGSTSHDSTDLSGGLLRAPRPQGARRWPVLFLLGLLAGGCSAETTARGEGEGDLFVPALGLALKIMGAVAKAKGAQLFAGSALVLSTDAAINAARRDPEATYSKTRPIDERSCGCLDFAMLDASIGGFGGAEEAARLHERVCQPGEGRFRRRLAAAEEIIGVRHPYAACMAANFSGPETRRLVRLQWLRSLDVAIQSGASEAELQRELTAQGVDEADLAVGLGLVRHQEYLSQFVSAQGGNDIARRAQWSPLQEWALQLPTKTENDSGRQCFYGRSVATTVQLPEASQTTTSVVIKELECELQHYAANLYEVAIGVMGLCADLARSIGKSILPGPFSIESKVTATGTGQNANCPCFGAWPLAKGKRTELADLKQEIQTKIAKQAGAGLAHLADVAATMKVQELKSLAQQLAREALNTAAATCPMGEQ